MTKRIFLRVSGAVLLFMNLLTWAVLYIWRFMFHDWRSALTGTRVHFTWAKHRRIKPILGCTGTSPRFSVIFTVTTLVTSCLRPPDDDKTCPDLNLLFCYMQSPLISPYDRIYCGQTIPGLAILSTCSSYRLCWWMVCSYTSLSTVVQSCQGDGRVIMKGCVQWNKFAV